MHDSPAQIISFTWTPSIPPDSDAARWSILSSGLNRIAPCSPFVPTTMTEWLEYRIARAHDIVEETNLALSRRDKANYVLPVMCGKTFKDDLSLVLARKTIWLDRKRDEKYGRGKIRAPWPSYE
ncbi:hypothetical protein KEM55_007243, partial [Ascosphaera atra]